MSGNPDNERHIAWYHFSYRCHDLSQKPNPVFRGTAVFVPALVAERREELVQQVAMGGMDLHQLEARRQRAPGRLATLLIVMLSMLMAGRYVWWRTTQTLHLPDPLEAVVGYVLFAAELYTWIVLLLGYMQTAWPLNRKPYPLPGDRSTWPTVDVYIPTYNEPLSVVQPTVYAATGIDWPHDKLNVYLLDDGTREEFRKFAEEAGVDDYIVKPFSVPELLARVRADRGAIVDPYLERLEEPDREALTGAVRVMRRILDDAATEDR